MTWPPHTISPMLYGVPKNEKEQRDATAYLRQALAQVPHNPLIFIGGGYTDPGQTGRTEAEAAYTILVDALKVNPWRIRVVPHGLDAREVLELLAREMLKEGLNPAHATVVCKYTHQGVVRLHAKRLFGRSARVVTVGERDHVARAKRFPRTLLAQIAIHRPWAHGLENFLRDLHVIAHSSRPSPRSRSEE